MWLQHLAVLASYSQYPIRSLGPGALTFLVVRWVVAAKKQPIMLLLWRIARQGLRGWLTLEVFFMFFYKYQVRHVVLLLALAEFASFVVTLNTGLEAISAPQAPSDAF